jgi:hypothetical protein
MDSVEVLDGLSRATDPKRLARPLPAWDDKMTRFTRRFRGDEDEEAALRSVSIVAAASCCFALGEWSASASKSGALSQKSQAAPTKSTLRCYAARGSPDEITCYGFSAKAEFRHGDIVYVPILIQLPAPTHPPSVTIVNSLSDVRPE